MTRPDGPMRLAGCITMLVGLVIVAALAAVVWHAR